MAGYGEPTWYTSNVQRMNAPICDLLLLDEAVKAGGVQHMQYHWLSQLVQPRIALKKYGTDQ
eukprot:7027422-Pyramimonas_sp.AAC.1